MPLRCVDEHGTTIEASACDEDEWQALRARNRTVHHLMMPCCAARAVLKTSRLATRFFAHKAKGGCTWKPETEVHRHLKQLALSAARETGWEAQTEASGSTPDGERWTADVLAWRGDKTIAVEIQWSRQTNEETLRRQGRYRQSGITGVWLLRQPGFPISQELPAARICGSLAEGLEIVVEGNGNTRYWSETYPYTQVLEPSAFLAALFEDRFRFGIDHASEAKLNIKAGIRRCGRCKARTRIVTGLTVRIGPHELEDGIGIVVEALTERIHDVLGRRTDIRTVLEQQSATHGRSYVNNACRRCGGLMGVIGIDWLGNEEGGAVASIGWKLDAVTKNMLPNGTQQWDVWETDPEST